ncbi:MAG: HNH endonuclease [Devosia sp.]|uniref:HNH endonuclease n=1 Tax=Devosia sp. 66-22 TaxID=1895753 RepID=UPI001AD35FF1|nr:HNH endonuclease [Devosia sp.]
MAHQLNYKHRRTIADRKRELRTRLVRRQAGLCAVCFRPITQETSTIGHVIPRWMGGPSEPWNLQAEHDKCNNLRGPKSLPGMNITASLAAREFIWLPE